jgi:hypothetical protein
MEYAVIDEHNKEFLKTSSKTEAIQKAIALGRQGKDPCIEIDMGEDLFVYLNPDGTITEGSGIGWANYFEANNAHELLKRVFDCDPQLPLPLSLRDEIAVYLGESET